MLFADTPQILESKAPTVVQSRNFGKVSAKSQEGGIERRNRSIFHDIDHYIMHEVTDDRKLPAQRKFLNFCSPLYKRKKRLVERMS